MKGQVVEDDQSQACLSEFFELQYLFHHIALDGKGATFAKTGR
jgi:hypothetical protein